MGESESGGVRREQMGRLAHIGIVVKDLEKTKKALKALFGVEPDREARWALDSREGMWGEFRGQPGNFRMELAVYRSFGVELEFIQPVGGGNVYAEFLEKRGEGLHHLLFETDEMDQVEQRLNEAGVESIQRGSSLIEGFDWSYLGTDVLEGLGFVVELRNKTPKR